MVVQWVRLHIPKAGGPGSILGWETRSRMHATTKSSYAITKSPQLQLRSLHATINSQHAATKDCACHN